MQQQPPPLPSPSQLLQHQQQPSSQPIPPATLHPLSTLATLATRESGEEQVREFLTRLKLSQYVDKFLEEGFDRLLSLFEVTEADLIVMGVKRGHRRLLQREIATSKGIPPTLPLQILSPSLGAYYPNPDDQLYESDDVGQYTPSRSDQRNSNAIANLKQYWIYEDPPSDSPVALAAFSPTQEPNQNQEVPAPGKVLKTFGDADNSSSASGQETSNHSHFGNISSPEDLNDTQSTDTPTYRQKRKYRRHVKPDPNAPVKPPSAYVSFANRVRDEIKDKNMSFTEIAKIVGEKWKNLDAREKEQLEADAARAKQEYHQAVADYEKTPEYRNYQHYINEFKNKVGYGSQISLRPRKRPKTRPPPPETPESTNHDNGNSGNSSNGNGEGSSGGNGNSSSGGNGSQSNSSSNHNGGYTTDRSNSGNGSGGSSNGSDICRPQWNTAAVSPVELNAQMMRSVGRHPPPKPNLNPQILQAASGDNEVEMVLNSQRKSRFSSHHTHRHPHPHPAPLITAQIPSPTPSLSTSSNPPAVPSDRTSSGTPSNETGRVPRLSDTTTESSGSGEGRESNRTHSKGEPGA
ncbi:uncharacterized protein VTP21DRAFT_4516 [Calcarisporiella thermophila]|uniref:uncharacterized protein n=1 Tax=Calcarisporiella thermophila TaxID=911321 RepID=UPI0037420374